MSEISEVLKTLKQFENTIFIISPVSQDDPSAFSERSFLSDIISRAIYDLKYIADEQATKEQKGYGRNALIWLFFERISNLSSLYRGITDYRRRKIQITSFDSICDWLQLDADTIRQQVSANLNLTFLSPFFTES
jgi:hypothetical protein